MQIAVNCLQIDPSYVGGLNTYTLGLLDGFAAAGNGCRFRLFVTHENRRLFERFTDQPAFQVTALNGKSIRLRRTLCRATLLSHSEKLHKLACDTAFDSTRKVMDQESDIVYTPTAVLFSFNNRKPTVLSMHDVQHLHYPEFFSWPRRLSRRITHNLSARYATYFQASSEFIKQDLLAHFPQVSPERIEVIPEGVNVEEFARPRDTAVLANRYSLPDRFLFFPAQLWPHKNHLTVLRALKLIEERNRVKLPLILTGAKYSAAPDIFRFIADQQMDYVRYLGKVPFEDLVGLYQSAAFLISPGLYESSSLPVLESAAAGTAVIASRIPPMEEHGRILQLNLFEPLDADDLARVIYSLWNDEKTAAAQVAHNRQSINSYSWKSAARKYVQLFARILKP